MFSNGFRDASPDSHFASCDEGQDKQKKVWLHKAVFPIMANSCVISWNHSATMLLLVDTFVCITCFV